jgi:formate dehydrogenase alpha subunit
VTGLATAFGSGAMTNSFDDLASDTQVYFIIGSNTTEQHPVLGMRIRQAVKQRGAKVIVCDPRRIPLTDFAVLHIRQKPGTDIALLNGIMHVLIKEDLYNKQFVAERTEGFEALKAKVMEYPPERAAEICGIEPAEIVEAAHLLAANRPGALLYAMGITQHITGHQNVLSCANLQMLLGNMGVPGGGVNPLRGQSNVQGACDMGGLPNVYTAYQAVTLEGSQKKFEEAWGVPLSNVVGITVVVMLNKAEAGEIKAMYIMGENPMLSDPDLHHAEHCLRSLDFLVVQDIFLTETAQLADVVLPATSWAEKLGTMTNSERRVQFVRPAVPIPGEAQQDWWIIGEIARRMGYDGLTYSGPQEIMAEINRLTPSYAGITYERIGEQGLQWPCPNTEHAGTRVLHVGKFSRGVGQFNAVDWAPPAEEPDAAYPFIFTTGRILYHYHTGTQTRRSAGLEAHVHEPLVEINTQDATRLGLADGQAVRVASRRGEITAKAKVSDMTEPGVVFMAFHWAEAAANKLTIAALDPTAKIPELKVCAVQVTAAA